MGLGELRWSKEKFYDGGLVVNGLMQKSISGVSVPFMKAILGGYDGFEGVRRLVALASKDHGDLGFWCRNS